MAETKQPLNAQIIHAGQGTQDAALAADPKCMSALRMKLEATEYLLKHNNRENFSEVRWLEGEVRTLRGALAQVSA
jgi:hypothetical protein